MEESLPEVPRRGLGTWLPIGMILALAAAGGAAAALLLKNASHSDSMFALEASPDHLDFGEVWEDAHFSMPLPIINHRGQDMEIKRFNKSCNCSRIEPPALTIPAWQTREVRLILDLTAKKPADFEAAVRDFEVDISPVIAGERQSIYWTIRGRVRSVMQKALPRIDFGTVSELCQPLPVKRAMLKTRGLVHNLTASCSSPNFNVTVEKQSSANANQFALIVAMKKVPQRGEIRCSVSLIPELSDGSPLPGIDLNVLGRIVGDIEALPASIFFGGCPLGSLKSERVTLQSLTDQSFTVTGMRCEGDGLSVVRQSTTSNGGVTFEVKQKVIARGEHNGMVVFRVRPSGGREEEIVIPVSYSGF